VCRNEWVRGVCEKPQVKCRECANQAFVPFDENVVRSLARERLFECDLHVVAQVGTALARGATVASPGHARQIIENIRECRGKIGTEPGTPGLERRVAIPVIGAAFVGVIENAVGLVDFGELLLAFHVARIAIGMVLPGKPAESR
jgi:hypothetical protein